MLITSILLWWRRVIQLLWPLLLLIRNCESIHLDAVLVPQYKFRGNNASLLCKYQLEPNEELFSLKWYKGDVEFYRHTPEDPRSQPPPMSSYNNGQQSSQQYEQQQHHRRRRPNTHNRQPQNSEGLVQTWPVPGIKIDDDNSHPQHVVLKRVTFKSTGTYRCEVTAVVRQRHGYGIQGYKMKESINKMVVVELPQNQPQITGGGDININYKPGDVLSLNCTSAPSNPPANLKWLLNDQPVHSNYVVKEPLIKRQRGLYSATIELLMTLRQEHFRDGELRVKCIATIEAEFWKKDVENVYSTQRDSFLKVLEVKESQWPDSAMSSNCSIFLILMMVILLPQL